MQSRYCRDSHPDQVCTKRVQTGKLYFHSVNDAQHLKFSKSSKMHTSPSNSQICYPVLSKRSDTLLYLRITNLLKNRPMMPNNDPLMKAL